MPLIFGLQVTVTTAGLNLTRMSPRQDTGKISENVSNIFEKICQNAASKALIDQKF